MPDPSASIPLSPLPQQPHPLSRPHPHIVHRLRCAGERVDGAHRQADGRDLRGLHGRALRPAVRLRAQPRDPGLDDRILRLRLPHRAQRPD
eukprot:1496622-Rhodomonas_salina.1